MLQPLFMIFVNKYAMWWRRLGDHATVLMYALRLHCAIRADMRPEPVLIAPPLMISKDETTKQASVHTTGLGSSVDRALPAELKVEDSIPSRRQRLPGRKHCSSELSSVSDVIPWAPSVEILAQIKIIHSSLLLWSALVAFDVKHQSTNHLLLFCFNKHANPANHCGLLWYPQNTAYWN